MFTGIIEEVGTVASVTQHENNRRLTISCSLILSELKKGDSVSVSGVCLTAVEITKTCFSADLAQETWARTSFSRIQPQAQVNLELPVRANGRFDGHIVQGHVDGTGNFVALDKVSGAEDYWLRIEVPSELKRYIVLKGSLCIEGISLTVAKMDGNKISLAIIPHTALMTNLKSLMTGDPVNLEVDVIAKYVEKMVRRETPSTLTLKKLTEQGF